MKKRARAQDVSWPVFHFQSEAIEKMPDAAFDYDSSRWKHVRAAALRRDGYQCRECRRYGRTRQAEIVHHIKHADEFPEFGYSMDNLISLCRECHNKAHPEKGGRRGYGAGVR